MNGVTSASELREGGASMERVIGIGHNSSQRSGSRYFMFINIWSALLRDPFWVFFVKASIVVAGKPVRYRRQILCIAAGDERRRAEIDGNVREVEEHLPLAESENRAKGRPSCD